MEVETVTKDKKHKAINSFFSDCIQLEGNAEFYGSVRVDCKINGKIKCNSKIFSGKFSKIEGDIDTTSFVCEGDFRGHVFAEEKIHIAKSGKVMGDVMSPDFTIEEGAYFEGACQVHRPKSKKKAPIRKKPKTPIPILDE